MGEIILSKIIRRSAKTTRRIVMLEVIPVLVLVCATGFLVYIMVLGVVVYFHSIFKRDE